MEVEEAKCLLLRALKEHNYDFQHPTVLFLSQRLDLLILQVMKSFM
ncbi:aspartyl-phosphate phosphatase Spo0E family protein [Aneurinibacillus terranovensis]